MTSEKRAGTYGRDRPKSDMEVLSYILRQLYGAERTELAYRLTDRFGGVPGIFTASYDELLTVKGITERAAAFFTVVRPSERQALLRRQRNGAIRSEADSVAYAVAYFAHEPPPTDAVAYISDDDRVMCAERIPAITDAREVIAGLCRQGARKFLWLRKLTHILPYPTRRELRRLDGMIKILYTAELIGARLVDYITLTDGRFLGIRGSYGLRKLDEASEAAYPQRQSVLERFVRARELFVTQYNISWLEGKARARNSHDR